MTFLRSSTLLGLAALASAVVSYRNVAAIHAGVKENSHYEEILYVPNGTGLRFMSFGYTNILANLLWFNTINYFGKHYRADRNYKWLGHMCGLVTELDPHAIH